MITVSVMTTGVNAILTMLTPVQRWQAARRPGTHFMSERWFILAGLATIIILTILLIVANYHRRQDERRIDNRRFFEYADKIGLTKHERLILQDIATRAGLRHNASIFSMIDAFDQGVSRITEDTLMHRGTEASKRLNAVISALREKLGFERPYAASAGSIRQSSKPNSRQIPIGKKLYLTYPNADDPANIESIVIKNDAVQLTVRSTTPLQRSSGELCRVRYAFGKSVWEFDATVVNCQGDLLALTQSKNIRFINRRRFLRVPVSKPAYIAHFPVAQTLPTDAKDSKGMEPESTDVAEQIRGSLDFVPAVVTELAGPGLRIESPLKVKTGDRVLIIFELSDEHHQNSSTSHNENSLQSSIEQRNRRRPIKVVENIGEIRNTEAIQGGFSVGVELTGLSDSDVNELIRVTNIASLKAKTDTQDAPASGTEDNVQTIPESTLV